LGRAGKNGNREHGKTALKYPGHRGWGLGGAKRGVLESELGALRPGQRGKVNEEREDIMFFSW